MRKNRLTESQIVTILRRATIELLSTGAGVQADDSSLPAALAEDRTGAGTNRTVRSWPGGGQQ